MPGEGTVRGTFELGVAQPVTALRELRREAAKTDVAFTRLGKRIDHVGSKQQSARIKRFRNGELKHLRRDAFDTAAAVELLNVELDRLGSRTIKPKVDLRGIDHALVQVELLHSRLRALDREHARSRVSIGGGFLNPKTGVQGNAGGVRAAARMGGATLGTNGVNIAGAGLRTVAVAGAAALPVVQALTGAVGALAGSLGSAGIAAAGIGASGAGGLAVGLGTFTAVAKPAIARIQDVYKAQTQYNTAQQDTLSVTQANTSASNTMRQSQRQLADAQRAARYAQESLTQSRRDARRALVDMSLAQDRAALGTRRAALALTQARRQARRVEMDPLASQTQIADAQLTLQEAQLSYREARVEKGRTRADYARAQRRGLERQPTVLAARRAKADAQRNVVDAKIGLSQAAQQMARGASAIASAKQELDRAFARAPRGTRQLIADTIKLRQLWGANAQGVKGRAGIDPNVDAAQRNVVRMGRGITNTLTSLTPTLGRAGRRSSGALLREGRVAGRFLRGRQTRRFIGTGAGIFDENLHAVESTGQHIAATFYNVTRAARPFLREATQFIDRWTGGWAKSTGDVEKTRSRIGRMVDSLKGWTRLVGAGGRLGMDIGGAGRKSGDSMVTSLTGQLNTWDRWIRRNPTQVREFFDRTVESTRKLARALRNIAGTLSSLATLLSPVLDRFSQLAALAGGLGLGAPGTGALAYGAFRGLRGGGAGRGGMLGAVLGGRGGGGGGGGAAAAALAAYGPRRALGTYQTQRGAFGASRLGAARTAAGGLLTRGAAPLAMGALRGAGRAFLPVSALMGVLDFASFDGSVGGRLQNAASGATLGLIPRPLTDAQRADRGVQAAGRFTSGLSSSSAFGAQRGAISALRTRIAANHARALNKGHTATVMAGRVSGMRISGVGAPTAGERRELAAQNEQLRAALADRLAAYRQYRHDRNRLLDQRSQGRAQQFFGEFQQGFRTRGKRGVGVADNMATTVQGTLRQIRHMRTAGGRELAQMTLEWARRQARANPALKGQYDRLVRGVEDRFKGLRGNVAVVEGQILDGSRTQWSNIADTISSQARRGVDATSAEFQRLNALAVGALVQMGYGRKDARTILGGLRAGGRQGRYARNALTMGANRYSGAQSQNRRNRQQGDGTGVSGLASAGARGGRQSSGLMGANAGLSVYAQEGQRDGLHVSSGLRPGAITASGNVSLHASGDAIDEAGNPRGMLRYARRMARKYGRGLDELIHTPLGFGIKNGRRVPLSFWGSAINAEHRDHVHVGDRTPGGGARGIAGSGTGGGLGSAPQIAARASRLGGVPGALSTAAGMGYGKALNARLAAASGMAGGSALAAFTGGGGSMSSNMRLGRRMMLAAGYGADQWPALKALWTGESNWNEKIVNRSSGATGIPQALPGSKMASAGADWRTNPATQIRWGLGYIGGRYGNPQAALSAWQARSPHWYGRGGQGVYRRPTMIGVGDGQPSGGSEEVTVRRIRPGARRRGAHGGAPSISLHVDMRGAVVHSEDDAKALMERAAEHGARKLLAVIGDAIPDSALGD